jgi:hypothetical protein
MPLRYINFTSLCENDDAHTLPNKPGFVTGICFSLTTGICFNQSGMSGDILQKENANARKKGGNEKKISQFVFVTFLILSLGKRESSVLD